MENSQRLEWRPPRTLRCSHRNPTGPGGGTDDHPSRNERAAACANKRHRLPGVQLHARSSVWRVVAAARARTLGADGTVVSSRAVARRIFRELWQALQLVRPGRGVYPERRFHRTSQAPRAGVKDSPSHAWGWRRMAWRTAEGAFLINGLLGSIPHGSLRKGDHLPSSTASSAFRGTCSAVRRPRAGARSDPHLSGEHGHRPCGQKIR
jgi:hypothetical protein